VGTRGGYVEGFGEKKFIFKVKHFLSIKNWDSTPKPFRTDK